MVLHRRQIVLVQNLKRRPGARRVNDTLVMTRYLGYFFNRLKQGGGLKGDYVLLNTGALSWGGGRRDILTRSTGHTPAAQIVGGGGEPDWVGPPSLGQPAACHRNAKIPRKDTTV